MIKLNFTQNGDVQISGQIEILIERQLVREQFIMFSNGVIVRISYDHDIKIIERHSLHDDIEIEYYPKQTNNGDVLIIRDEIDDYVLSSDLKKLQ